MRQAVSRADGTQIFYRIEQHASKDLHSEGLIFSNDLHSQTSVSPLPCRQSRPSWSLSMRQSTDGADVILRLLNSYIMLAYNVQKRGGATFKSLPDR